MIRFRSPVTRPLHPPRGDAPREGDHFYVTQRFDDPDFYYANLPNPPNPLPTHRATDIGNGQCGYPIVAMAPGVAYRTKDDATRLGAPTDALGIRIDHGQGVTTAYWHLASWSVANGVRVSAGQEIGKLGNTGLGQICHCHIEATLNGQRIDPEPLMFGGSLQEDDVLGEQTVFLATPFRVRIPSGVSIRTDTNLREETRVRVTEAPLEVTIIGRASGVEYGGSRNWHVFGEDKGGLRCVHSTLTERIPSDAPAADCTALENRLAGALTAVKGAQQAINATRSALEG
jgi:hypothetical protein